MTFALIPAAGTSSRMGQPKLTLPLGERTVVEHVIAALQQAGIAHILVVAGPHLPELVRLAQAAGVEVLVLAEQTAHMRATVEQGLRWLETHLHPRDADNWLLVPADHPTLSPAVIAQLLWARDRNPRYSIVVPICQGRRGHPALLSWEHVAGIKQLPAHQGLNVYLRQHADATLEVPVDSPDSFADLDTPEDYERWQRAWLGRSAGRPPWP